ncbi:hypothetical protein D9611_009003 [Ephemerocybe angulata]|uniref:Uncharacterized protein n=1 Tax=Ephemerocybe angulata TaxID=980116 RepID=A0A8H5BYP2_9AGAR|nr:hypothetical protein D9611_009003 [Tulosesus angulatus]
MMAQSALDPESVPLLKEYANGLLVLQYMDRERERLFLTQDEYEYQGADYGIPPFVVFLRLLSILKTILYSYRPSLFSKYTSPQLAFPQALDLRVRGPSIIKSSPY